MPTAFAKPLPVPVCSIVGGVLGGFVGYHQPLEQLFYEAGAVGKVPPGNCVIKCQSWFQRLHEEVSNPAAVLGKVIEEFMTVDNAYKTEEQQTGREKIREVLARFGLSYHAGGLILARRQHFPRNHLLKF